MASTYRQVGYGSTGSAVSKLQTVLNQHGYDLAVDGIFGVKTQAAVRDYQKKNSLKLDGIAGPETWGSLLAQPTTAVSGGSTGFSYDPAADAAFQSYARQYAAQGRSAMTDTLGQAAHLTGGYGSSYAQSAAQQSYQRYLQQLSDVLPQLQSAAYTRYRDAGDALLDRYQLLQEQESASYDRWQDQVAAWQKEVAQARSDYEDISSRDLKNYQLLLNYYADKAAAEQKGMSFAGADTAAVSSTGNTASLSSTAAESLERAMRSYHKSGSDDQAVTLLNRYKNRMTPAQKARFEALFAGWDLSAAL